MEEHTIRKNSLAAWILAARPKTLSGASVPVIVGLALALADLPAGKFMPVPALLCMLFAFVMQIDANFVNDYYDFVSGKDDELRLGPPRACAMGWIGVKQMRIGIIVTTVLSCIIGFPLVLYGGVEMILVGALCVVFCFLYTTFMASRGLGDVLVLVFFGIIPVCLTYYLQTATVSWQVFIESLACGMVIDTLLIVNNFRDIENDHRAGKRTLIVRIGSAAGLRLYLWMGLVACITGVQFAANGRPFAFILPLVYAFMHFLAYRKMKRIGRGRELNLVLADTARNMFIYGVLVAVGVVMCL